MIVYNMRYRGPLEYDKFVLNTFQFHNEVNDKYHRELLDSSSASSFADIAKRTSEASNDFIGKEKDENSQEKLGFSKEIYLFLLDYREV